MFDIDVTQWRALVKAAILTDLRTTGRALDFGARSHGATAFAASLLVFMFMGTGVALIVSVSPDRLLGATAFFFLLAFLLASSLLIEYQAVVLSPADYRQLAFQPVSSPTFLAARLTSVLVYVLAMTGAFALAPLVAFLLGPTGGPSVAAAAAAAALAEAVTVTMVVIGLYVGVLRFVPAARLSRGLSYLQLAFGFVIYGGYMAIPRLLGQDVLLSGALPRTWWLLLFPPSWFAGWVSLAGGERSPIDLAAVLLSLAALAGSVWIVAGRLSLDYAARLGEIGEGASLRAAGERGRPLTAGWLFASGEARAVSLLVRAQFRYDTRFRLTVLSILPLTAIFLIASLDEGGIDPFSPGAGLTFVYFAVMMFPPLLRTAIGQSDAYRAAWIFHGTPADKGALVLAVKRFVLVAFVLPFLACLYVVYVVAVGRPAAMLLHVLVLGLASHLIQLFDLILNPDVPFSKPVSRGRTASTFVTIMAIMVFDFVLNVDLGLAYATTPGTIAVVAGLAGLNVVGEMGLRERLRGLSERAQFDV